jgi:hypothetical protein
MDLAPEDDLRLNVLMASAVHAIRIDEASTTLYALSEQGEAQIRLSPNCRPDAYLRRVREVLSGHVLGSPGGYPIFLRRWTRMGDITATNLEGLLLLGEPEAVVAVVRSPGLTAELARRAWWALPSAENARRMLAKPEVAASDLAPELAAFLVEFLPFEEDPADTIESVRLVLQPGLIDPETRARLWHMGGRKNALRVGFLAAEPRDLPMDEAPRPDRAEWAPVLGPLAASGNPFAELLTDILGGRGQAFLRTAEEVLRKPATQEVVSALLNVVGAYFGPARRISSPCQAIDAIVTEEGAALAAAAEGVSGQAVHAVLAKAPSLRPELEACLVLARLSDAVVTPIFSRSDAVGSVMRRQIAPVTAPLLQRLAVLRGKPA